MMRNRIWIWLLLCCLPALQTQAQEREQIVLKGRWQFRIDSAGKGLQENWQRAAFAETVQLPGTMEENRKGRQVQKASPQYLNQTWQYAGAAWYQKEIEVPASWGGRPTQLFLERTKATRVWIDGRPAGESTLLSAPQVYRLGQLLTPGKHTLTIMVNNDPKLLPVGGSHILSEHTQTNWNGIIGNMYLEALPPLEITQVQITPDVKKRRALVKLRVLNHLPAAQTVTLELKAALWNSPRKHNAPPLQRGLLLKGKDTLIELSYPLGPQAALWSEYTPALYRLNIALRNGKKILDRSVTDFGLREFKTAGTQFAVNGVITFLRGKNDGCIFPLTGYPPTDTAAWRRLYRIAKSYGINHYRFHSYTPPQAAFAAADAEGIYIQAELPNWSDFKIADTFRAGFQLREGLAILDAYGNHASFVMCSLGNELSGDDEVHNKLVRALKAHDPRRLYAHGTNAFYADPRPGPADDFWVTMRTGKESPQRETDVRGSFATTEDVENGLLNACPPNTRRNFAAALKGFKLPVVGHETGQYQVYPNYQEIPQYTGVLKAANLGIFRDRLQKAGMGSQAEDFFKASGKLTALLYREEIEMVFRTPGMAGFQLLDLQDFPGQGTALVGLLNAFMESKGLIDTATFRSFNSDVVLQLLMDKYTWAGSEIYAADVQIVNYSPAALRNKTIRWTATHGSRVVAQGSLPVPLARNGGIQPAGRIRIPLQQIRAAAKLTIRLEAAGVRAVEYPVWVYPQQAAVYPGKGVSLAALPGAGQNHQPQANADITIATALTPQVTEVLNAGGKVLLFPDHQAVKNKTVGPQFIAEFWNWLVFKGGAERMKRPVSAGTLGILTDPEHPLFRHFPTEFHTNWQWWHVLKNARPLVLDKTDTAYRPIVQVIDNIDRNHKLGLIFECRTGKGSLLVCMANLPAIQQRPEARQLYYSMLEYMRSSRFQPQTSFSMAQLQEIL